MITVVGGTKGGSGKSTVATNLAVMLAAAGRDVLLVDADDQETSTDFTAMRNAVRPQGADYTCVAITGRNVLAQLNSLSGDTAIAARKQRAKLFNESADYTKAAKERLMLAGLLAGKNQEDQTANNAALWQLLLEWPEAQLATSANQAKDINAKAWYELGHLYKSQQYSTQGQLQALNRWMKRYPEHPAAKQLPKELLDLQQQLADLPKQIALLMPQSGKLEAAASAIVDGLMAAYYQQQRNGALVPTLKFYNTEGAHTLELYQKAVQEGADIVIGPLEKERLADLEREAMRSRFAALAAGWYGETGKHVDMLEKLAAFDILTLRRATSARHASAYVEAVARKGES